MKPYPRQLAVALGYDPELDGAPRVLARGAGLVAEHIKRLAKEFGVPVREERNLAEALARLDVGAQIPEELYIAVAEVLAFLYRTDTRYGRRLAS